MNKTRERFGLEPREVSSKEFEIPSAEPEVQKVEFPLEAGIEERVELTPWSSYAYLDRDANRFRDTKTGILISGEEYRARQSAWRTEFLGQLLQQRFPDLLGDEREVIIMAIEDVRYSDLPPEEKDTIIRDLIGSP